MAVTVSFCSASGLSELATISNSTSAIKIGATVTIPIVRGVVSFTSISDPNGVFDESFDESFA